MDFLKKTATCVYCLGTLNPPFVALPCTHIICQEHCNNSSNIVCSQCSEIFYECDETTFSPVSKNNAAFVEFAISLHETIDFGPDHKQAKEALRRLQNYMDDIQPCVDDPFCVLHENISSLRDSVQLKCEEMKLAIDELVETINSKLDKYEKESSDYSKTPEFIKEIKEPLDTTLKSTQDLVQIHARELDKINFIPSKWQKIAQECDKRHALLNGMVKDFRTNIFRGKYYEMVTQIEDLVQDVNQKFAFDIKDKIVFGAKDEAPRDLTIFDDPKQLEYLRIFLPSTNVDALMFNTLSHLLYRASRDGFEPYKFRAYCAGYPQTLTLVRSKNKNIFGGFASLPWLSSPDILGQLDPCSFLFSLKNEHGEPFLFLPTQKDQTKIYQNSEGPVFGDGFDLFISGNKGSSNLGYSYSHPKFHKGSLETNRLFGGKKSFEIDEIEVFELKK